MEQAGNRVDGITCVSVSRRVTEEDLNPDLEIRRCDRRGCRRPAAKDCDRCRQHEDDQRRYDREYQARRYEKFDKAGLCTRCGDKRWKGSQWCARHLAHYGKAPRQDLKKDLENKRARIEARIRRWEDSPTNAGRERLRGGVRGAPSTQAQREQDTRFLEVCVQQWNASMALVEGLSGDARKRTELEAMSQLGMLERYIDEIRDNRRYEQKVAAEIDRQMREIDRQMREIDRKRQRSLVATAREIAKTGR